VASEGQGCGNMREGHIVARPNRETAFSDPPANQGKHGRGYEKTWQPSDGKWIAIGSREKCTV